MIAVPVEVALDEPATADEIPEAGDGAGESFESATPVEIDRAEPAASREAGSASAPSLEGATAHVPAETRALLRELFKAEIGAVRRLARDRVI